MRIIFSFSFFIYVLNVYMKCGLGGITVFKSCPFANNLFYIYVFYADMFHLTLLLFLVAKFLAFYW